MADKTRTLSADSQYPYTVAQNFPKPLDEQEVLMLRGLVTDETRRVMMYPEGPSRFDEPVIAAERESLEEAHERMLQMIRQLQVGLRHIDELKEIDAEVCGQEESRTSGKRLPVERVSRRGKQRQVRIHTKNSWGGIPLEQNQEAQQHLRSQCMRTGPDGKPTFDASAYAQLASHYSRKMARWNLPILGEDDRVDIFDEEGNHIGSGVVREAAGDTVRLHLHSASPSLKAGCFLRKRSNRKALDTYQQYLLTYCEKLYCEHRVTNSNGMPYRAKKASEPRKNRHQASDSWGVHTLSRKLSLPEKMFFSDDPIGSRQGVRDVLESDDEFRIQDIPREIIGDDEQASAFALGAMGHPCFLIQGPPGTGKTTVASLLAKHFQQIGKRTLILSHSNRGLDVLLRAARDKNVDVERGGTEESACHHSLRDVFIRKGLKHPRRADFLSQVPDQDAFAHAMEQYDPDSGDAQPRQEDFMQTLLDDNGWRNAWSIFEHQKQEIIHSLDRRTGLVAGVTLNSLISDEIIQALSFDVVIVDEASKGFLYEFLPALEKAGKQIIFIGDHQQLGNISIAPQIRNFLVDRPERRAHAYVPDANMVVGPQDVQFFEDGPFTYLQEHGGGIPKVMLRTNRRSLPNIVEAVSWCMYEGKLKAGRQDEDHPANAGRLVWVDTSGRPDNVDRASGSSRENILEAKLLARRLMRDFERGKLADGNVGVIAMYNAQKRRLWKEVNRAKAKKSTTNKEKFVELIGHNLDTVDGFQGSQRGRIAMSLTRSSEGEARIGHLKDPRRLNVGISRAQDELVIVGNMQQLIHDNPDLKSKEFFRVLAEICRHRGQVIDTFSTLPANVRLEEQKSQTRNARRQRKRRAERREEK